MSEENVSYGGEPKYQMGDLVEFEIDGKKHSGNIIDNRYWKNNVRYNHIFTDDIDWFILDRDIIGLSEKSDMPYGVSYVADKPDTDEPENVRQFRSIINKMLETYKAKNADYGDSFEKSIEKYGAIAGLTRISDKFNRLENLLLKDDDIMVPDESIIDTLLGLANYSVMLYMAIKKHSVIDLEERK